MLTAKVQHSLLAHTPLAISSFTSYRTPRQLRVPLGRSRIECHGKGERLRRGTEETKAPLKAPQVARTASALFLRENPHRIRIE